MATLYKPSMPNDWTYSHTQIEMWRSCQRLYHDVYVLGHKKPTTPNMAFGTWMLHTPIEGYVQGYDWTPDAWEGLWANYLAEFGGDDDFDDPIFTLKTAKKCLDLYKKSPIEGDVQAVEEKFYYEFPDGLRYVSKPDFIVEQAAHPHSGYAPMRYTVDLKFTTAFKVAPLLPYDDQLLGQAIVCKADGFIRATFKADRKSGRVEGPAYEEHALDKTLVDEWIEETWATCREIKSWRQKTHATWVKNPNNCFRYGVDNPCHRLGICKGGFVND